MQDNLDTEKGRPLINKRVRIGIIILTVVFLLALISIGAIWFNQRETARRVLKEGKLMQLAVRMTALEYYGLNESVYDLNSVDGFADGVVDELRKVSGCNGEIYLISWDEESLLPVRLEYIKDGYVVDYVRAGKKDVWNVYRFEHVIVQ